MEDSFLEQLTRMADSRLNHFMTSICHVRKKLLNVQITDDIATALH